MALRRGTLSSDPAPKGRKAPCQVCSPLPSCTACRLPLQEESEHPAEEGCARGGRDTHQCTATATQHSQLAGQPRTLGRRPVACRVPLPSVWHRSRMTGFEPSEKRPITGAECLRIRPYPGGLSSPPPSKLKSKTYQLKPTTLNLLRQPFVISLLHT